MTTSDIEKRTDEVTLTIDGVEVKAPKGELVIRTAERLGIEIPRFCDHPLLAPAGACRQCLVEVEGQRKPVASCTQTVADGMVVKTQLSSPVAAKAQAGIMELLLINHPLDCPMCDKGGECPLQNQAMAVGRPETRFHEHKREYEKPINISSQVLLDRERCVLCQRCTRFSDEIAGDKFIDLMDRSSAEQINVYRDEVYGGEPGDDGDVPFNSYFSGNTVQICPVGALTGTQYRFRARPFDLVSSPSTCEHCASGCAQRTDHRRGKVLRRLAGEDPEVNEEWNCDKGRWGFQYATAFDRLTVPLIRENGELRKASWTEALAKAAEGLRAARDGAYGVGVLTGGRLTVEDAYAYAKFARVVLHTNNIDFRARPQSQEEAEFLAAYQTGVTYADIDRAKHVVLVGFEPEEESPIVFLRLRKTVRGRRLRITAVAPYLSRGLEKLHAKLVTAMPGREPHAFSELSDVDGDTLILVGERLATVPGGLSGVAALASANGARLAWIPRRAGDRGAVDAGCLPNMLPGGRTVADAAARAELSEWWGVPAGHVSGSVGLSTDGIIEAAAKGKLGAMVVAGVDPADLPDPRLAEQALDNVNFLISLELRMSAVSRRADVVFPVAAVAEKAGSFVNWEGRLRTFDQALDTPNTGATLPDARVLDAIAAQLGISLGTADVHAVRRELSSLPASQTGRPAMPTASPDSGTVELDKGQALLATWSQLLDLGSLTDGDEVLAGTARPPVVRLSKARAAELGIADGDPVTVGTQRGAVTLPALITELPDQVVWLPTNSPGSTLRRTLGPATVVTVSGGKS
ncbi:NADH-quinone oxidoreductase [Rhizocola hellebori]|uniref:NADH-quinone oxidoreductase n=1 Tax=Rhizocola hellebori TaxID=1392758 RepID=A0A8J3QFI3_9ACTN|nr:NADH-quinone oxidoreductase subunit G [Rhizocola hellebori]GIH09974.1 NADH-quinone oxidoreductase [Rhizocola hellebori]